MMHRLPVMPDEWIDRSRELQLRFEGQPLAAFAGDSLSTALAAAGIMTTARSFKYHRPRGIVSAAGHDANNLFQIGTEPNQRGDQILARDGLDFEAVNTRGGVARDRGAATGLLSRFLPVGFYYKAFIGRRTFPWFEKLIRNLSGLGRVHPDAISPSRQRRYQHCDVAVIGAGIAGLSAAMAAADNGAKRVVLIDEAQQPGGSGLWHAKTQPGDTARCRELVAALRAHANVQLLCSHSVVGYYADHELAVSRIDREDGGLLLLRARAVVLATGCIEQPAVFRNNDLPGVLLGSAAQRLLYRHGISVGHKIVVLGANDEAVSLALDLLSQGLKVTDFAVPHGSPAGLDSVRADALRSAGVSLHANVREVAATAGSDGSLANVMWTCDSGPVQIACDCLLISTGWMPALHLALQFGGLMAFDDTLGQHVPQALPAGLFVAGRANGCFAFAAREADGAVAGARAACHAAGKEHDYAQPPRDTRSHSHPSPLFPHAQGKEFVDLDEDLTLADLANAAQEGFDSVELLKRYSTVGMGPSQGKLSNLNAARQLARVKGSDLPSLGLTTARPPWQPVSLGALAGARFAPLRRTALDGWHETHGATWMPAGNWRRPAHYGSIEHEVHAVRNAAGLIDVSTLGKIEVMGRDAGLLLDRMYVGVASNLAVGRTRYAVMLDEAGTIIDDGVVSKLADGRFYITTTTGGSAAIYRELQRRVAEWQLDCTLHNATGHIAGMNLAGPRSRQILARCTDLALDDAAFPYLGMRECSVAGSVARIARVGFVGELGFEIHVPFDNALKVWDALISTGESSGLIPFGVEAQRTLRLEKGHIIVGQDTDGLTNPFEAGMGRMVRKDKGFFIGQRSLSILEKRGNRQQLIGFSLTSPRTLASQPQQAPLAESHLAISQGRIVGRITSIAHSATLDRTIGLALLSPEVAIAGNVIRFRDDGGAMHEATLMAAPFYDATNARQRP
ncbi:MAG: FAD-dependent oxidoreductase [Pseudomonadota bacterium]